MAIGLSLLAGCNAPKEVAGDDRSLDFTADWAFRLGDDTAAARLDYNDADWRKLNLPHDWAVEGEFSRDNPSGTGGGALPGGIGWYRKTFIADKVDEGKRYRIDFDGVYMNSTVYINGHELGTRPYGYISFSYDLTPYIKWGEKNVIAVRVDNAEQPNSRWYSGCGIYRNVWLTKLNPVHVAQWGTYVTAEEVSKNSARLKIRTSLQYDVEMQTEDSVQQADGTYVVFDSEIIPLIDVVLQSRLVDADGHVVGEAVSEAQLMPVAPAEMEQEIELKNPNLWSIDAPYMYKVESILKNKETGEVLDRYYTPTGIRTFRFDAQKGFILNGEQVKINGVCMHHDLGCLGAAVNTRAIERQLEILKEMGCNGIRCSHNSPAPELLDLCDRMGFIVMDETFDMWRKKKTRHDYSRYFNEWHERDLTDLIVRDRNHPSIFMWSIGNEVLEQWTDAKADTLSLEEANLVLNFGHSADMLAKDGEIDLGGVDIRTLPLAECTKHIAYVSQDNYLFDLSVMDNIRMGRKGATDAEVIDAAKKCGCHEFIMGLENGYQTVCGASGGHLSGGERQRISIARAMLKDAPIVILDEATSYTDPENEAVIQSALGRLVRGKTLLVIAHRLSTIADADQIIVVNQGKIEATGTQAELLASCPLYQTMWEAHISVKDDGEVA